MPTSRIAEVLYDSETVLRLVDSELDELRDDEPRAEDPADGSPAGHPMAVLLASVQHAQSEITGVLQVLHDGRTALREVPAREIEDSIGKLHDVCAATEAAATRIMDGVDRAQAMIEQLDLLAEEPTADGGLEEATVRARIREELFAIIGSLQFQDITSQQLGHVSKMLGDVGRRVHASALLLDGACDEAEALAGEAHPVFAESASTRDVGERQAAADALFWAERVRKAAS